MLVDSEANKEPRKAARLSGAPAIALTSVELEWEVQLAGKEEHDVAGVDPYIQAAGKKAQREAEIEEALVVGAVRPKRS